MTAPEILLANPRGFCAGVDRAIEIVNRALELFGAPIHVRHEVVHKRFVVDDLRQRGPGFVEELDEVPEYSSVIFSAHGVTGAVQEEGERLSRKRCETTGPQVTELHMQVIRYATAGRDCVLFGHRGNPEVEGTRGRYDHSRGGHIYLMEDGEQARHLEVRNPRSRRYD